MEYSGDAFYSFLNLDSVSFLLHLFLSDPADPVSISLTNGHVLTLQFLYCISFEYFLDFSVKSLFWLILSVKENVPNNSADLNIRSFSLPAFMDNYISL